MNHARWETAHSAREGVSEEYGELYEDARLADELAQKVYDRRIELGLSQTQLAARAGMKQPQISRLEGGGTLPTLPLLRRLAKALDLELNVGFSTPPAPQAAERASALSTLEVRVVEWLNSAREVAQPPLVEESDLRDQLALLHARRSWADVEAAGATLVQLKVAHLARQLTHRPAPQVKTWHASIQQYLEQIRTLMDTAVDEAEDEVRRLEDAH